MYIAKYFSTSKSIDLFQKYRLPLLTIAGMTASLLASQSAFSAVSNPGAICQSDSYQDRLTSSDYNGLMSTVNTSNYQPSSYLKLAKPLLFHIILNLFYWISNIYE